MANSDDDPDKKLDEPSVAEENFTDSEEEFVGGEESFVGEEEIESKEDLFAMDQTEHKLESANIAYAMSWRWADFHIYIINPIIAPIVPPVLIPPAAVEEGTSLEHVYPILDQGFCLSTSRCEEIYYAGMSMCKMSYTIEKMVTILIERLKSEGISTETEVKIAFDGFELAQRKGFESIINLNYNVVVTNFEPGIWGERYLATVRRLADKGYGYPLEAPRNSYRHIPASATGGPKR